MAVERSDVGNVGNVADVGAGNALAVQAVGALLPKAVRVAGELLDGKHKASAAVRGNLAAEILRQAGKMTAPAGQSAGMAAALALLGRALGARAPRTVDGAAVVVPDET
jgi:hypothetical protein